MTDAIRQWMEKYIAAWETNAPDDIRALFAEDAVYATRPYDPDAWRGREQIVDRWIASADEPEDWRFEWSVLGSDGDLAFVQGRTTYLDDRPSYENLWVVRLAPDGRATAFTEWFMERKT
ncbi:nuclear transport factor 2 family protein [Arthrobacter pascens]|uniref:nuclear transport factor 2 family protein n=1 Tax=Arthrobacter pascens TaxID=1677 RepID=UPI00196A61D3|nr:nuclear transport factor 2 family protein [Arthrobacter pascens]MBN3496304.1 nuclear transport factor 2 family protein [Arthrobacter pascens]MDR6559579.1 ketosteroid isomerase-like protein [Arthrobacter pascens]